VPKTISVKYEAYKTEIAFDYLSQYPFISECNKELNFKNINIKNYSEEAPSESHKHRITRAIIVYLPLKKADNTFMIELKWLYTSWIEMQKYEPALWRTDLIVFAQNSTDYLNELNCSSENIRTSKSDLPMCTIINYIPINKRKFNFRDVPRTIQYYLNNLNIFDNTNEINNFYGLLKHNLQNYPYTDSILMAFDGYHYFRQARFDYLIRSDMDVFLTPLFSKWLPKICNDFYVGKGGYSVQFNMNRLARIASNIGLNYGYVANLGSTWYSTPEQFRLVSYLTLVLMSYLSSEEFTSAARQYKLHALQWPDWHYGVVLLYGQHIALNHLIATRQMNVVKLQELMDYPASDEKSIFNIIHIHCFHDEEFFSKFNFMSGQYDNLTVSDENSTKINYYALKMASKAKSFQSTDLYQELENITYNLKA